MNRGGNEGRGPQKLTVSRGKKGGTEEGGAEGPHCQLRGSCASISSSVLRGLHWYPMHRTDTEPGGSTCSRRIGCDMMQVLKDHTLELVWEVAL